MQHIKMVHSIIFTILYSPGSSIERTEGLNTTITDNLDMYKR